jgi:hypothetical protein
MSRGLLVLSAVGVLLAVAPVLAANPSGAGFDLRGGNPSGGPVQTPEMWFYEQYQRDYHDPDLMVRRNAEFRAEQRRSRLASMQWFGFSNARPRASSDPLHADYSPYWTGNNSHYPYRWHGAGWPWLTLRTDRGGAGTY